MRHGGVQLGSWDAVAASRPAALMEPAILRQVGPAVARVQGAEDGVAGSSSLLLALDVLGPASADGWRVLVDDGCYPTLNWAAAWGGMPPIRVPHHRADILEREVAGLPPGVRPILATDGYCVGCGRAAPLSAYAAIIAQRGGRVLVDDTQAFGLGPGGAGTPAPGAPSGSLLRLVSLSKAFNVPLAVLSGTRRAMAAFREVSVSRLCCSPPAIPVALAALRALRLNSTFGGQLRAALRARILTFRHACSAFGVLLEPGLFPVQTVVARGHAVRLVTALAARGIRMFASRGFHDRAARLRLIVTAAHDRASLWTAAERLAAVLSPSTYMETVDV